MGCQFKKVLNFNGTYFLIERKAKSETGKNGDRARSDWSKLGMGKLLALRTACSFGLIPIYQSNVFAIRASTFPSHSKQSHTTLLLAATLIKYIFMQATKVLSLHKKQPEPRQPYKKPVYKSYKQLLHLDRPKKKIEYESSSSQEDFLERLLNEEAQRSKSKKRRKKTTESARRRGSQERQRADKNAGKEDAKSERKGSTEIKLIREGNGRSGSANERNSNQLALIKEEKPNEAHVPAIKFTKEPQNSSRRNSIYIDNKSTECPAITYSSTNHLFQCTLKQRKSSGYRLLLAARKEYQQQLRAKETVELLPNNKIQHSVQQMLESKFRFAPKIEPITPNWRYNLTVSPMQAAHQKQFIDRKTLFHNQQEEERFVRSLRELSRRKY